MSSCIPLPENNGDNERTDRGPFVRMMGSEKE